jgi:hypothetical protein
MKPQNRFSLEGSPVLEITIPKQPVACAFFPFIESSISVRCWISCAKLIPKKPFLELVVN